MQYFKLYETLANYLSNKEQLVFQQVVTKSLMPNGKGFCFVGVKSMGENAGLISAKSVCKKLVKMNFIEKYYEKEDTKNLYGFKPTKFGLDTFERAKNAKGKSMPITQKEIELFNPLKASLLKVIEENPNQSQTFLAKKLYEIAGQQVCDAQKCPDKIRTGQDRRTTAIYINELVEEGWLSKKTNRVGEVCELRLTEKYLAFKKEVQAELQRFWKTSEGLEVSKIIDSNLVYQSKILENKTFKSELLKKVKFAINETQAFLSKNKVQADSKIDLNHIEEKSMFLAMYKKYTLDEDNNLVSNTNPVIPAKELYQADKYSAWENIKEYVMMGCKKAMIDLIPTDKINIGLMKLINNDFNKRLNAQNKDNQIFSELKVKDGIYISNSQLVESLCNWFVYNLRQSIIHILKVY